MKSCSVNDFYPPKLKTDSAEHCPFFYDTPHLVMPPPLTPPASGGERFLPRETGEARWGHINMEQIYSLTVLVGMGVFEGVIVGVGLM